MNFSLKKTIAEIASKLCISERTTRIYLNGGLGTRWIYEKNLNCSEVELSMFLKSVRKRLIYDFYYCLSSKVKKEKKIKLLQAIFQRYQDFDHFHYKFFKEGNSLPQIKKMLCEEVIIVDSGISKRRFFQILPRILKKISPNELNLCFMINTLIRWRIAVFLQSKIKEDLYVRGSLFFFYARSFGCGHLANFPQESFSFNQSLTSDYLQGSDLDLRVEDKSRLKIVKEQLSKYAQQIQKQFLGHHSFLTIEIASSSKGHKDDTWSVKDFSTLRKLVPTYSFCKDNNVLRKKLNFFKIKQAKRLQKKENIHLNQTNLKKLVVAFKRILSYHKLNEDFIHIYVNKWKESLKKTKRETDFHGLITKNFLFLVFEKIFFLSGCRLSKKDQKILFNELLEEYEKTKI